jgi:hypothetical protein
MNPDSHCVKTLSNRGFMSFAAGPERAGGDAGDADGAYVTEVRFLLPVAAAASIKPGRHPAIARGVGCDR